MILFRRSNATPSKLFSVDSYDLKFMTFKFGDDIFEIFMKNQCPLAKSTFRCYSIHLLQRSFGNQSLRSRPTQIYDYNSMRKGVFYDIFSFTHLPAGQNAGPKNLIYLFLASMGQLQSSKKLYPMKNLSFLVKLYAQSGLEKEVVYKGMRQHGCSGCTNPQIFGTSPFAATDFEASSTMCTRCFENQSSPGCTCTRRSKFLTHSLTYQPLHCTTL